VSKNIRIMLILTLSSLACLAAAELRDPTLPAGTPKTGTVIQPNTVADLKLNSIFISGAVKRAIINGVSVATGNTLADGSKVLKISPRFVVVKQAGVTKKLFLVPSVKKPVK
jgi:hypothetical protein